MKQSRAGVSRQKGETTAGNVRTEGSMMEYREDAAVEDNGTVEEK